MRPYLLSLGAGLVVGIVYSLRNLRSPAPPAASASSTPRPCSALPKVTDRWDAGGHGHMFARCPLRAAQTEGIGS
jgi:uncharacterized protein DUF1427